MTILHIETATNTCSVALSSNGRCLSFLSDSNGQNHGAILSPFIRQTLQKAEEQGLKLDAVAVSSGPGSYTGLRIGVSTVKGLCYGYGIPMIAVSTLETLCVEVMKNNPVDKDVLFCPMIDARRMEVYTALYTTKLEIYQDISAKIIDENSFQEILEKQAIYFFGNGAEKCKPLLTHPNARFIDHIEPLAKNMIPLAEKKHNAKEFVDVAYFEPFYLKEFQTTTPKKLF